MSAATVTPHPLDLDLDPADAPGTVAVLGPDGRTVPVPDRLALVEPLPGLPGYDVLSLEALDDTATLFAARSLPGAEVPLRLFLVAPGAFFPAYRPGTAAAVRLLDEGAGTATGTGTGGATVLLAVVHPVDEDHEAPTANLLAPVVVDVASGRAVQTVLEGDWPLRARLA
ncbi:flagellar assembly protein FliW [Cellulomonas marina]|uniref:Flagellar assembly factor FliW n=1 Tax=Cellulomonas marina TaxID=988821 RepID=A0A1I0WIW9_9CELL|nr:flagellar assembly protein FliW [Cellulomonas marina]GIG27680.1 hypothetical protein Cma02nite_02800 [Cellulomonas marina]SFA88504.1 flagellar assembly factor FliW [Cellulomonas marina]